MKKKHTKNLRKMAEAIGFNKSQAERKKIYRRLKSIQKQIKGKK